MTGENLRLFLAVNLPTELKQEIAEKILPLIPKERWRKVLPENLHITMHFLGYLPRESVARMRQQLEQLENFEEFEAEINCVGHFKGRVLWLGIGKGSEQFNLLNKKLQEAIGTHDERFHPHVTLARNKGAKKEEVEELVEALREKFVGKRVLFKSLELMLSQLRKSGPKYSVLFSVPFTPIP
jgi:2'-5' RNA ligase